MLWSSLAALALVAPSSALIRFHCSQLVTQRIDPLVEPGVSPSGHLHQIVGGNMFNASMPPMDRLPDKATCTTCEFTADFSNYWTAVLYFRAKNGTYKRVPQRPNLGFEGGNGGMTVYYMQDGLADYKQTSKVKAFQPGFRMIIGNPGYSTRQQANKFRQLTYTCLDTPSTRYPETMNFPAKPCASGIMTNLRFPTCWDGKNLDSPDHMSHMSYPEVGTFEGRGPCPANFPVRVAQVMYEVIWETQHFNNKEDWPEDGQPFVWSTGDGTGYGTHGDYLFGWRDNALQEVMDSPCYVNCPVIKNQTIAETNKCSMAPIVNEQIDGWLKELPGSPHMRF